MSSGRKLFIPCIVLTVLAILYIQDNGDPANALSGFAKKAAIERPSRMQALAAVPNAMADWPPTAGKAFPAVALQDHNGQAFDLAKLKGKPTLVEFIAMTCAGCQAWSGGNKYGAYENLAVQKDLEDIETYFNTYTNGLKLHSGKVNFVQLIIYNIALEAPRPFELQAWRKHFRLDQYPNTYIITGGKDLCNQASFEKIPGFLLLDKNLIVRFEALGHSPRHDLYRQLLPGVRALL